MSDKDLLDLLIDDDNDDGGNDNDEVDLQELQDTIVDLQKQNNGLLKAKQSEKVKRQETQTKLKTIETKLNSLLEKKGDVDPTEDSKGVSLDFTEDGVPFVPKDKLDEVLKPSQEKITDLEQKLAAAISANEASKKADRVVRDILSEDEQFPSVYTEYKKARKWVNQKVIEYQKENNIEGFMTSGQALDTVFNTELEQEFSDKFDGMELDAVITAEDSEKLFRKMLKTHASRDNKPNNSDDKNTFKKVLKKPSGLGDLNKSTKGSELSVMDKLDNISTDDFMELSDAKVEAILSALQEEESGS